jgi:hypothetical protein
MSSCGADNPVREPIAAEKNQKETYSARARIARTFAVFVAALREIFDESAYERFLDRQRVCSSPRAYSDFLRETETAKARRPKCC